MAVKSSDELEHSLGAYFREMSDLTMMNPEQELSEATAISLMRINYWNCLLRYPPFIDGIRAMLEASLDEDQRPVAELRTIGLAARRWRDRDTRAHQDAFDHACDALAEALGRADCECLIADRLLEDLQCFERGDHPPQMLNVRPPRRGSRPYKRYVDEVCRAQFVLRTAKHRFVKSNLRLVVSIAQRFNHGRLPLQDLIQEGNIGLMKAVDRYDHRKGFRFSTYGSWWIRHAISRSIADKGRAVRLPVHMIDTLYKVSKVRREFEKMHGREPTIDELASSSGVSEAKLARMQTQLLEQPVSLDRPVTDDGRAVVDILEDGDAQRPGEKLEADAVNEQLRQVITALRPIEADILRKRFGLEYEQELTLKEIGDQYSLSRERIRQLQEQALGKIRRELRRRDLL